MLEPWSLHGRLRLIGARRQNGRIWYFCNCECPPTCTRCKGEGCKGLLKDGDKIRRGITTSCGCYAEEVRLSKSSVVAGETKFGDLLFLSRQGRRWTLRCDAPTGPSGAPCGKTITIEQNSVAYRGKVDCGCRKKQSVESAAEPGQEPAQLVLERPCEPVQQPVEQQPVETAPEPAAAEESSAPR